MKKLLFSLSFLCLSAAQAQIEITSAVKLKSPVFPLQTEKALDTITTYMDRASTYNTYSAGSYGFILGTCNFISETAVHFSDVGVARVSEAFVYFSNKNIVNTPDTFNILVYSAGADSMPSTILTGAIVPVANVNTSGLPVIVGFPSYAAQSGDFLISVEYTSNVDDTLSLYSTNTSTFLGGPDGNMEKRVRQKAMGTWMRAYDIWTIGGLPYNADALIVPIVDIQSAGMQELGSFKFQAAYPCPANEAVNLDLELSNTSQLNIKIMDARGALIHEEILTGSGMQTFSFATDNLTNGQYYYILQSDSKTIGSKFQVQH